MFVDDERLIAMMVSDQIAELGYSLVGPAHSIMEACRLAADESFDAALVDWNLDGTNASEVADILIERQIPFGFFSGYSQIPQKRFANVPVLNKPFSMIELRQMLEALLPLTTAL
jgi:CheY-like chemotaxis protein